MIRKVFMPWYSRMRRLVWIRKHSKTWYAIYVSPCHLRPRNAISVSSFFARFVLKRGLVNHAHEQMIRLIHMEAITLAATPESVPIAKQAQPSKTWTENSKIFWWSQLWRVTARKRWLLRYWAPSTFTTALTQAFKSLSSAPCLAPTMGPSSVSPKLYLTTQIAAPKP